LKFHKRFKTFFTDQTTTVSHPKRVCWTLTPAGHEYSHGYRGVVVEDAGESGVKTAVAKVDVITETITLGAHD